jgi:membrane protein
MQHSPSMLFSWYVASFGNYNETYGSLGAVIGLLTWMWLSTIIVLVGAELNAEIEHQTVQDTTEHRGKPLGARGGTRG